MSDSAHNRPRRWGGASVALSPDQLGCSRNPGSPSRSGTGALYMSPTRGGRIGGLPPRLRECGRQSGCVGFWTVSPVRPFSSRGHLAARGLLRTVTGSDRSAAVRRVVGGRDCGGRGAGDDDQAGHRDTGYRLRYHHRQRRESRQGDDEDPDQGRERGTRPRLRRRVHQRCRDRGRCSVPTSTSSTSITTAGAANSGLSNNGLRGVRLGEYVRSAARRTCGRRRRRSIEA